jgi:hypothetical protein
MGKRLMEIAKKEGIQAQEVCPIALYISQTPVLLTLHEIFEI